MTRQAIARGRRVRHLAGVVDAVPLRRRPSSPRRRFATLAQQARVPILVGSDQIVRGANGAPTTFYNSAFLVRADGTTGGVYRKMHLVPFGEYVPLQEAAVLRGAAGRGGLGLFARARTRCCCRSAVT